jgi:uncharacterized iron-regulated protein
MLALQAWQRDKRVTMRAVIIAILCAGCASGRASGPAVGTSRDLPVESGNQKKAQPDPWAEVRGDQAVARAALPFVGLRSSDGERLEADAFFAELAKADLVCLGEDHANPHHHWAELQVARELVARAAAAGRELAIGFEMVARPRQPVLDAYAAGELDERELFHELDWPKSWGHDFGYYRPLFELAKRERLRIAALNAPSELVRKVSRKGLAALDEEEQKQLPELELDDEAHRAEFDRLTEGHPPPAGGADRMYAAQVVWDETMADSAAEWLKNRLPVRQMLVIAGSGHCHSAAIPSRLTRRAPARIANVRLLALPAGHEIPKQIAGYGWAFVMTPDAHGS